MLSFLLKDTGNASQLTIQVRLDDVDVFFDESLLRLTFPFSNPFAIQA